VAAAPHLLDLLADGATGTGTVRFVPSDPEPRKVAELWDVAGRAGAALLREVGGGDAVGLLLSSTPEAVTTLVGAWRAGLRVVSLPHPGRNARPAEYDALLRQLCAVTDVGVVVSQRPLEGLAGATVRNRTFAEVASQPATRPVPDECGSFVQFTSGSTSNPKGVELSLNAIGANICSIIASLAPDRGATFCSWLPLSHDMGLIGQLLASWVASAPAFTGETHLCLIATEAFQANPSIWLRTCSEIRATHAAVPNFGLDLAARFLGRTQSIDLSSMEWWGCGAEPVRAETLRSFTAVAGPFGFPPSALSPCYGMAEASLAVTLVPPTQPWTSSLVEREALREGRWVPADATGTDTAGIDVEEIVGVGRPVASMEVRIDAPPGRDVGQIEFRGPSMLTRYIGAASPFTADGWVRTGDEGVVGPDGELFVLGRTDDVIVLRGRNLYVIELESVAGSQRCIRPGNCAVVEDGAGRYVVVAERRSRVAGEDELREAARAIRRDLIAHCGVAPSAVLFTPSGSLPRTPSGKVQRHRIRRLRGEGSLPVDLHVAFGEPSPNDQPVPT